MATVLITGGTGLIGSALTNELLNRHYDVIILTRSPGKIFEYFKIELCEMGY